ncbi:hypothetical protein AWB69_00805 [Caballeronia udeis]|uniref:Uncharacterized protein n=1 Tax=Caballeronia udeis TaxID=1232866 RepID=A0A158F8M5_9BURK|nr:hypothetical protein AWB69_00805 [Caballeronia udeis]
MRDFRVGGAVDVKKPGTKKAAVRCRIAALFLCNDLKLFEMTYAAAFFAARLRGAAPVCVAASAARSRANSAITGSHFENSFCL